MAKLKRKYSHLLSSTAKLLQRTAKQQKSNRDLERTVKYLRALYNQVKPQDHSKGPEYFMDSEETTSTPNMDEEV